MEHGKPFFHYEIFYDLPIIGDGKRRQRRKRAWLPDDAAAEAMERALRGDAPAHMLAWREAWERWRDEHTGKRAAGTFANMACDFRRLLARFGEDATIEGTSLAAYSIWLGEMAKGGKTGRAGAIAKSSTMVVAKWAKKRGLIASIPFADATAPEVKLGKRRPATLAEYAEALRVLREVRPDAAMVWELLGLTGMRLGAALGLREGDIDAAEKKFTVTTKGAAIEGRRMVDYPLAPEISALFARARAWKRERGFEVENVFLNRNGHAWSVQTFDRVIRDARSSFGEGFSSGSLVPHSLRHMAGTLMAKAKFTPDMIQAGMGHADRRSSETYIDHDLEMRAEATKVLATSLQQNDSIMDELVGNPVAKGDNGLPVSCPHCGGDLTNFTSKKRNKTI